MLRPSRLLYLRLSQQDKFAFHPVIDAASHQKDLVKSKSLWTDDRVSLHGSMPRLIKETQNRRRVSLKELGLI